jgi:uncharacterized membrane protein YecN with MAPEG domain
MFATPIGAVALYTGLNALLLFALALNVGLRRGAQNQLEPGAMGDATLTRAIRAHGNFTEYAPLALLLLLVLAWLNAPVSLIHGLGAAFLVGRIAHAFGMMKATHPNAIRFAGNLLTGLVLLTGAGTCFYFAL